MQRENVDTGSAEIAFDSERLNNWLVPNNTTIFSLFEIA